MTFAVFDSFFPFVTAANGYVDVKAILANAIGTIIGGLFLTVLYFAFAQKPLGLPRLGGGWVLESVVSQTKYNPFKRMVLGYKILLLQDGTRLHGTAEKVYEKSDKVRLFNGVHRTTAVLEGTIQKSYLGRSTIILHVVEEGKQRAFSWIVEARCRHFGSRTRLIGRFSSTAGDASGTVVLQKTHHSSQINEYRGFPLYWFGRSVEVVSARLYGNEWNKLEVRINRLAVTTEEFWKTHNCHVLVAALVVAEDRRFYSHSGTDLIAICRALYRTVINGEIQGGSTIEQQLVRRLTADYRKSTKRKLKEIALAVRLHQALPKDQIPIAYLISAYYGWRMNGLRNAARRLSIDLKDPTLEEAAQLVARIRYPEPRHPSLSRSILVAKRQDWIARELLARMYLLY